MLAGALVLAAPLFVATQLHASADGLGTHQQLGLPPCSALLWWGVRCPACGMTTSWAHLVRGDLLASIQVNPGGAMLGLTNGMTIVGLIWHAARARLPSRGSSIIVVASVSVSLATAVGVWIWRVWLNAG
jgi:hypothetical protein